jgi:hypothetical protein
MSRNSRQLKGLALGAALAGTALAGTALAGTTLAAPPPNGAAAAGFARLKALSGEWVAAEDGPLAKKGDLVARYAVTAGGSAVVETVFPGQAHEMVTVYHVDGPDLVLTHYCMDGNQPRMRARKAEGPRLDFAYDGGTNIDPRRDRHMNSAWLEFLGADEIRSEWTELAEGKTVLIAKSHLVRQRTEGARR